MDIGLFINFTASNKDYRRCSLILHSKFNTIYVLYISIYQVLLSPWWYCNNKPEDQYPWLIYEFYECHLQHMTRLIKLTSRVHGTSCRYIFVSVYIWFNCSSVDSMQPIFLNSRLWNEKGLCWQCGWVPPKAPPEGERMKGIRFKHIDRPYNLNRPSYTWRPVMLFRDVCSHI